MFSRIVIALDGSDCANHALDVGLNLAKATGASVTFCSVVDPATFAGFAPPSTEMDQQLKLDEDDAAKRIDGAKAKAAKLGLNATGEIVLGKPAREILDFAKRESADAIVLGTHGRTGVRRVLLGSVAEDVLRHSHVPVLVVRQHVR